MEKRIVYIHGFNGSPDGTTGTCIKSFFDDALVVAPALNLLDYDTTLSKLKNIINDNDINIIIGHSLGAFYALALNTDEALTIVINPCMYPSLEIPKLAPLKLDDDVFGAGDFVHTDKDFGYAGVDLCCKTFECAAGAGKL